MLGTTTEESEEVKAQEDESEEQGEALEAWLFGLKRRIGRQRMKGKHSIAEMVAS